MIAGIYDKEGIMMNAEPGVTLTSASEVLLCNKAIESVLPRLSPDFKARVEDVFAPLGEAACSLQESLVSTEDEEELSQLLDEMDASSDTGSMETSPVVSMDLKAGKVLEVILKKYAEREDLVDLSPRAASVIARQIDMALSVSVHSGISFN